jgi:hypothetical protein
LNYIGKSQYFTGTITQNQWNHLVFIYNGGGVGSASSYQIYVNGVNQSLSSAGGNGGATSTNYLGWESGGTSPFSGKMDEVLIYNTSLTASQVSQLYKSGLSQHANTNVTISTRTANSYNISDPSLVAFWGLNDAQGTTFVEELGRYNGTCSGTACPNATTNTTIGGAMRFDGTNDVINITEFQLTNATGFTLSAWVNEIGQDSGYYMFLGDTNGTTGDSFQTRDVTTERIQLICNGGITNPSYNTGWATFLIGWIHLTATSNTTGTYFYLNGNYMGMDTEKCATFNVSRLGMGYSGSWYSNGLLDEVRIYNRSLSASEVLDLYNLGATHISDWSAWTTPTPVTDGVPTSTNSTGKFMQFQTFLNSNDSDITPYLLNHTVQPTYAPTPVDSDYPYFITIPANATLNYSSSALGVQFVGNDTTSPPVGYAINWTNTFQINQSGWLSNATTINTIGVYLINVTINDTTNKLNSTIYQVTFQDLAPTIIFNYKEPTDINLTYLAGENAVNITYNITDLDSTPINTSKLILCHKTNSTTEDITQFMNGTASSGYRCSETHFISNDSTTYLFNVKGNGVIPATYNIDEEVFEDTPHIFRTLTTQNQYYSTTYLNVSNDTQYNLFEQMVNSSVGAGTLRFYACNNSFAFDNAPASNTNCYNFNSLSATQSYHHNHSEYSSHQIITLVINETTGTIGTVKVTPIMHFIARGSAVGTWYIYQIGRASCRERV